MKMMPRVFGVGRIIDFGRTFFFLLPPIGLAPIDVLPMRFIGGCIVLLHSAVGEGLRGVAPGQRELYEKGQLRCPGPNGRELTPEMINDDFCDCPDDGFDEPGVPLCLIPVAVRGRDGDVCQGDVLVRECGVAGQEHPVVHGQRRRLWYWRGM